MAMYRNTNVKANYFVAEKVLRENIISEREIMKIPDDIYRELSPNHMEIKQNIKEFEDFLKNETNSIDRALNKFLLFGMR